MDDHPKIVLFYKPCFAFGESFLIVIKLKLMTELGGKKTIFQFFILTSTKYLENVTTFIKPK